MPLRKVAQEGYFLDKRGKIVDIMQVVSKDLENMSEIEKEIEFLKLWKSKEEHKEFIMRNLKIMGNGKEKSLEEMSFHKKCQVLSKMSNQNIQLFDV